MKLNCIACGNIITLDERVYEDFEGPVKCNACAGILKISMKGGKLMTMEPIQIVKPSRQEAMSK